MKNSPLFNPVFYRTYSRRTEKGRESYRDMAWRAVFGLQKVGNLTHDELLEIQLHLMSLKAVCSGRAMWVMGTEWRENPENFPGAYNCVSRQITSFEDMAILMDLAMQGCGTGAVLTQENIDKLPTITTKLKVTIQGDFGTAEPKEKTVVVDSLNFTCATIYVGDSRDGWASAFHAILVASTIPGLENIVVDLSAVRPKGTPLKGFGGVANPEKLPDLFPRLAKILNRAVGRKLKSTEACLLIDEAALVVVAGNIRRSAGMRQFSSEDTEAAVAKDNLWIQDYDGAWKIDPNRDAYRMANHTRVFHHKPSLQECIDAVTKQYYSGEGAIMWAGEAVARANADLLDTRGKKLEFLRLYATNRQLGHQFLSELAPDDDIWHRMARFGTNPCGEIIGTDFFCNLSSVHLPQMEDSFDNEEIHQAFRAAALSAVVLLHDEFEDERFQYSREIDPIIGVSFTGLFDFFVKVFGPKWVKWCIEGRPETEYGKVCKAVEAEYLANWREVVEDTVQDYCKKNGLRVPNRCTTIKPEGTQSCLSGSSSGWHPPKSSRYIRRVTFGKNDPVALACVDYGYNVVPSQSDKDEDGKLLDDPFSPLCTEWLVEIPIEKPWADLVETFDQELDVSQIPALAQFDLWLQCQQHYAGHTVSATIELKEEEITPLATRIYDAIQNDEGYVGVALLAKFEASQTFPRLPFEPISKVTYERLQAEVLERRKSDDFHALLAKYDKGAQEFEGPAGCDNSVCLSKELFTNKQSQSNMDMSITFPKVDESISLSE